MSYEERTYVQDLRDNLEAFIQELAPELVKQSRRPNRESEKRTRKLLMSFHKRVAVPFKKASIEDLAASKGVKPVDVR